MHQRSRWFSVVYQNPDDEKNQSAFFIVSSDFIPAESEMLSRNLPDEEGGLNRLSEPDAPKSR
jgi:hypothetical protein